MTTLLLGSAITRKYICCFCAVVLTVLLLLIPVFRIAYRTSFDNASDELSRSVEKASDALVKEWIALSSAESTGSLDALSLLPVKNYRLENTSEKNEPSARTAVAALRVWKDLQTVQWQMPNAERLFLLFSESELVILSDLGVFYDGYPDDRPVLDETRENGFARTGFLFTENEGRLIFSVHNASSRICACAVYSENGLRTLFGLDALPEDSFMRIYLDDALIYSSRDTDDEGYVLLTSTADSFGVTVSVGISESYFLSLVKPVYSALSHCLVFALLIGLSFAVGMGVFSAYPIRRLVRRELADYNPDDARERRPIDELSLLGEMCERSAMDLKEKDEHLTKTLSRLRETLREHAFVELLAGLLVSERELEYLPELSELYQVALLNFEGDAAPIVGIFNKIGILAAMPVKNRVVACVPDKVKADFLLAVYEFNLRVSEKRRPGTVLSFQTRGSENLRQAYLSACSLFAEPGSFTDGAAISTQTAVKAHAVYSEAEILRLVGLMRVGEAELVRSFFSEEALALTLRPETATDARNLYDQLRAVLLQLLPENQKGTLSFFEESEDPWEQLERIRSECLHEAERVRGKLSIRNGYKFKAVRYIEEHACDPLLCVDEVAARFDISGRQVYTIVRESQGVGFSEYLLRLRMEKAAILLRDHVIRDVAALCGFSSVNAFYKAFKRYYSASPGQFASCGEPAVEI
ncbi:MAG: AraC family transcriptional regulator [Clostridiaceae bacterium]|nr:AraC family transcriptional regulator [Clostridiaceae bacterium]